MQYFWCCVVDCGEVEGCAAVIVLYINHPFLSPQLTSGSGGGRGEVRRSFIVGRLFQDTDNVHGARSEKPWRIGSAL